jgi:hypothetical protein
MRVRAQDANGDYTFGHGSANFFINSPACVAQLIQTNLLLHQGEWFLNLLAGVPWETEVLGYGTASLYDVVIKTAILNTRGVTSIINYSSSFNPTTRKLTVTATVLTQFSTIPITVGPITL